MYFFKCIFFPLKGYSETLNLTSIILSLNSYDYGGVGGVGCGYNDCDNDDDVGDYDDAVDDNYDYDHHDHDDGDGNF